MHPCSVRCTFWGSKPTFGKVCLQLDNKRMRIYISNSNSPTPRNERSSKGSRQQRLSHSEGGGVARERSTQHKQNQQTEGAGQAKKINMLIVVEGVNDMKAVRRAVNADVYVLGTTTRAESPALIDELRSLLKTYTAGIVLLLDPDVAGRQARNSISSALGGQCWHAFVPSYEAVALKAVRSKKVGNVGVEHATPKAIVKALERRRKSTPSRIEFNRNGLLELGLIAPLHERGENVAVRRHLVCSYLGLGACDGKQLLRQLNSYDFTRDDVSRALAWAEDVLHDNNYDELLNEF